MVVTNDMSVGDLVETGHVGAVSMADPVLDAFGRPENYDFRQHTGRKGRIVLGQEYLTAFDGETGEIIDTVEYIPERGPYDEATGTYDTRYWGLKGGAAAEKNDGYANRADRFLAGTAYLDDGSASTIFARGYYGRSAITAWKLIDGKLQMQWAFDIPSDHPYAAQMWSTGSDATYDCAGNVLYNAHPSVNFSIYWDGDLQMELFGYQDGNSLFTVLIWRQSMYSPDF